MKIKIVSRYDSTKVLLWGEYKSLKDCLERNKGADLIGADLIGANLREADLYGANLIGADLSGADLIGADLIGANLREANLYGANLIGADLSGANLIGASLIGADLSEANLYGANLIGADLSGANLIGASLIGADLSGAENFDRVDSICPEGQFTAFKKCVSGDRETEYVVELLIPAKAKRLNAYSSRKIRVSEAKVVKVYTLDRKTVKRKVKGLTGKNHTGEVYYAVGKTVKPDSFDDDLSQECSHGIHCFLTFDEAKEW